MTTVYGLTRPGTGTRMVAWRVDLGVTGERDRVGGASLPHSMQRKRCGYDSVPQAVHRAASRRSLASNARSYAGSEIDTEDPARALPSAAVVAPARRG